MNSYQFKMLLLLLGMVFMVETVQSQQLNETGRNAVMQFKTFIEARNWEGLSREVRYPLRRAYPLPTLENESDFRLHYAEIFDDSLLELIDNSSLDSNWSEVGWRGIMLNSGVLWIDTDGKLVAVNYQSEREKTEQDRLIEKDRSELPAALRNYVQPILTVETDKLKVRIDELEDGSYRYVAWDLGTAIIDLNNCLIGENGELDFFGSGGNHSYTFQVNDLTLVCEITVLGKEDDPPARLLTYQGENLLMTEDALMLRN